MKRPPTREEEQDLLKTIHTNFLIGVPRLLKDPKYTDIDFTKTLKTAVKKGFISINPNGLILSLHPKYAVGDIPDGVYSADKINNPHSTNETYYNMKKSQLRTLLKEIIKEISRGRVSSGGNEYENYEIELESLAIPGISNENQGATITVNIEYNADPEQHARGMVGTLQYSDPAVESSIEITNISVVGVKIYDENGENEVVVDLNRLTSEQLKVITSTINSYVDQNRQRIESEIMDSVDTEPDYPDDRDER